MRPICFAATLALFVAGCGGEREAAQPVEMVPLEQLPAVVTKAAQERLPDVKFDTAWKTKEDGREVYEVRGKSGTGKVFEVEVAPDGTVVRVE